MAVRLQRIYDEPDGGHRVLVDRLWPRGVSKQRAALDAWAKDIAPSDGLRKEFHAGALSFDAFRVAYVDELTGRQDLIRRLFARDDLVLVTASKDPAQSHVQVLVDFAAALQNE